MTTSLPTSLRSRRETLALSASDLAGHLGVHPTSIHRWERRERLPGPTHIVQIAQRLQLPTSDVARFFDEARPPVAPPTRLRATGLRRLRRSRGVSARRVASALGVLPSSVYNWESGRARLPEEHLPALARLLALDPVAARVALRSQRAEAPPVLRGLRLLRHRSGLSQSRLAELAGVSRRALGTWERGGRPPLHAVRRLAGALGVPVSAVAGATGVEPPRWLDRRTWQAGDLPDVLRVLREWSGLTQRELALRVGCSADAVRAWEAGRGTPRARLRGSLEQLYGLAPDELLRAYPAAGSSASVMKAL